MTLQGLCYVISSNSSNFEELHASQQSSLSSSGQSTKKAEPSIWADFKNPQICDIKLKQFSGQIENIYSKTTIFDSNKGTVEDIK